VVWICKFCINVLRDTHTHKSIVIKRAIKKLIAQFSFKCKSNRLDKNGCKACKTTVFAAKYTNLSRSLWLLKLPNMDETVLYYINSDDNFFGGCGGGVGVTFRDS